MTRFELTRALALLAFTVVGLAAACSSNSDSHAEPIPSGDGGAAGSVAGSGGTHHVATGGSGGGSSGTGASSSAPAGQAGQAEADAGAAGLEQGNVVVVTPGACSETATWMGEAPLDVVSTNAQERLLSITADELDVAFLRDDALYLAHRSAPSLSFGAPTVVAVPAGYTAEAGAALSSDGKTLVLISSDGQSFAALTRDSRTAAFGATADASAFLALNLRAVQTLEHYAAPVLAPDGKSFVFAAFTPPPDDGAGGASEVPVDPSFGLSVVYESVWSSTVWAMPTNISQGSFDGTSAKRPLPSGLSSDSRTLFYFDEATSKEVARFRDRPDAPLDFSVDLGDLRGAIPNSQCNRIYYSSAGDVATARDR
jgi:hypothetical protein